MPYRFVPIAPKSTLPAALAAINNNFAQLDQETAVKTFNGPNGNRSKQDGELDHGFIGTAYYDSDGNCTKLEAFDSTGVFVELTVKDGEDAYTVLGY